MDTKEKLLGSIEERLTVYANWINQGGGIRSDASEDLYRELLNTAWEYELVNMNWVRDNFPAIDLGDQVERLAVQVTSTGDAAKVRKTLDRFYAHGLGQEYDRLIVLIAGKAECKPSKFEHPDLELEIWGTTELMEALRKLSVKKLREVEVFLQERVDAPKVKEPVLNLPVPEWRNPVEILGRESELSWIRSELEKGTKPVIVAGLGGMGKTVLTIKFRKKYWKKGHAYFVRFRDSFTRTLADSVGMAIPVEERKGLNEEQTARLALSYLRRCGESDLLILDNAEVPGAKWSDLTKDPFYGELRRLGMAVLMTTRHRDTGGLWLGRLEQEELREIFRRHEVGISVGEMDALIEAVDGHTMTVDMIARTIRESWGDVTAETILTAMKTSTLHQADFDDIENDHDPEQGKIYAHLRALFDLSRISEDGKHALRCATLLPQSGMDEALFRHALPDGAAKEIKRLEKKGWVDRKEGLVTIHPVVRLVCRTELEPTDGNCEDFLVEIAKQYDRKQYDIAKFHQLAELFETAAKLSEGNEHWAMAAGSLWSKVGEPGRALNMELWAMKLLEQKPADSEFIALIYNNVGMTYADLGDYEKALECVLNALTIRERILPDDHLDLSASYNNVGQIYGAWGNYDKALRCGIKALDICERVYSTDHPDFAACYNNVGSFYGSLGDHKQALKYKRKAMEMWERVLPVNHPELALSYNSMSITYSAQGDHEKTLEYLLKALAIQERNLHENHPDLAQSYNNLGYAYGAIGNHEKALKYQMKTLTICERTLCGSHPHYAVSCNNIAWTYYRLGRLEEAATYMRRAADIINRSTLPENHPHRVNFNKWADRFEREARQERGGDDPTSVSS